MSKRILLEIAYDGTAYCGFQVQKNGITIEEVINDRLSKMLGEDIRVIGASRTDSGVHALCNVAVFDTETRIPPEKISFALNRFLPEDIRVRSSREVEADFHPRHADAVKTYEYRILNCTFPVPTLRLYTHFVYYPLDVEKMREAAAFLVGEHDFASFCSSGSAATSTVRRIYSLDVLREDDVISITVSGNGFLYNMVRIIAGTLIEIGLGTYPTEHVGEILKACDRNAAGPTAPACGLTLKKIEFCPDPSARAIFKEDSKVTL